MGARQGPTPKRPTPKRPTSNQFGSWFLGRWPLILSPSDTAQLRDPIAERPSEFVRFVICCAAGLQCVSQLFIRDPPEIRHQPADVGGRDVVRDVSRAL